MIHRCRCCLFACLTKWASYSLVVVRRIQIGLISSLSIAPQWRKIQCWMESSDLDLIKWKLSMGILIICAHSLTLPWIFLHTLLLKYSHEILQDLLNFPSCNLITKYRTIINHNIKWLFDVHPRYVIIYHCVDLFLLRHSLLPNLIFIH